MPFMTPVYMNLHDRDDEYENGEKYLPNEKPQTSASHPLHYDEQGKLIAYAWPGGYPIFYPAKDGGMICPDCANGKNGSEATEDPRQWSSQWLLVGSDVYWEGPTEQCAHCNGEIESAYGDPDASDDDDSDE